MKKLISLLLVICILCPLLIGCINQNQDIEATMEQRYLRQFNIEGKEPEDVVIDYDGGTYNGARIVMLDAEMNKPVIWSETIAEATIQYYDTNRLYAYKSEKFYTLAEAYANYILYSKDIVSIAEKFNKEVTHFTDTCDKYDFPEGKILEVPDGEKEYINYRTIHIYFSPSLFGMGLNGSGGVDYSPLREYLDCDMIGEIGVLNGLFNHSEFPDYGAKLAVALLKEETRECAEYVMNEIVGIPGVIGVSFAHSINVVAEATNGSTYSSNEYWWLDEIQVEKVWEFTKGSSVVYVGIMDMGIYNHSLLMNNFIYEYDYSTDSSNYTGDITHGTFIVGIVGAKDNSIIENIAVNKNVSIVSFLVDNEDYDNRINMESVKMALDDAAILLINFVNKL